MKQLIALTVCLFTYFGIAKADNEKPIQFTQLPAKAQEFVKEHFADKEISLAKVETEFLDKKYQVVFVNGEKVEFDKKGDWTEVDCKFSLVPESIIPEQVKKDIERHFPKAGVKVRSIERDSRGYDVKLTNKYELEYNADLVLIDVDL